MIQSRRGVADQQFHWIFVLIAGAIIVLFFISVIISVRTNVDRRMNASFLETLDTILSGAQAAEDVIMTIRSGSRSSFEYYCDPQILVAEVAMTGTALARQNTHRILFSHPQVQGGDIFLVTRSIAMPFRIDNAVFMSDPSTIYIVVGSSTDIGATLLYDLLPDTFPKRRLESTDFSGIDQLLRGYKRGVVIVSGNIAIGPQALRDYPVNIMYVNFYNRDTSPLYGQVEFYENSEFVSYEFLTDTMLLGALVTADSSTYRCVLERIRSQAIMLAELYMKRIELLQPHVEERCKRVYASIVTEIRDLSEILARPLDQTRPFAASGGEAMQKITDINREVEFYSCPIIY